MPGEGDLADGNSSVTPKKWESEFLSFSPILEARESDILQEGNGSAPPGLRAPADKDVAHERFMDRRMYMQATQGRVDDFIRILHSISSEKELQRPEILSQVSPRNNTCLHIAVRFGHHTLAEYIMGECPDLIKKTNSKGDTALHIAARKRDLSFVKFVMDSCPSGIGASRDEEVVEILIKADPQVAYYLNKEGKSPLYLAAEANYFHVVDAIENSEVEERMENRDRKAKPAVHGAILGKNNFVKMLDKILAMKLVHQKDKDGRTPLHCAASIGYLEGVQMLLRQSNFDLYQTDSDGFCPIHVASRGGYVDIVKELLQHGKDDIVDFVLKREGLENLINEKDNYGNTPLHLATWHKHAKVVHYLTWDKRVDLNLVNEEGQTALDIAESMMDKLRMRQTLIGIALMSARAQRAPKSKVKRSGSADAQPPPESKVPPSGSAGAQPPPESKVPPSRRPKLSDPTKEYKDMTNTLLLVSTLVATVTFAAGFTMPGGYNSSNPNASMATLLMRNMFHVFVICNTIAMHTSILAAITLIWAHLHDTFLFNISIQWGLAFLGLAVIAMSLGFMASVYLAIALLIVSLGTSPIIRFLYWYGHLAQNQTERLARSVDNVW
ncbi:Protein accellerated cell death 6 [Vitis vinifera]|uniref:Protein accellerated cell death 6 n=1 Tax=Vitis vinifera TaxID=29760 RepID=A0A438CCP5_VITVI|nr:Protein accellerated cell death 6 [Vitis vinifera]